MKESTAYRKIRRKNSERGSAIVESVICMLVLCLVLFGLLQIFMLTVAQEITDYTAFMAARSLSVGFNNDVVDNEIFVRSVPASGALMEPSGVFDSNDDGAPDDDIWTRYGWERRLLNHFAAGEIDLVYEYWDPAYSASRTELESKLKRSRSSVTATVTFSKYPMNLPFSGAFFSKTSADVKSECTLGNNSSTFLVQ